MVGGIGVDIEKRSLNVFQFYLKLKEDEHFLAVCCYFLLCISVDDIQIIGSCSRTGNQMKLWN